MGYRAVTDDKMLDKVRKLLSKAERAGTEHEAEAFTAKATEFMLKYAIDEAQLQAHGEKKDERIVVHKVTVQGYAKAKLSLMHKVAQGLGLRSVQYTNGRSGWSTGSGEVVGWESDVESFKVLFASLQMQAASEAARELKHLRANFSSMRAERDAWNEAQAEFHTEVWRIDREREDAGLPRLDSPTRQARRAAWMDEHPEPADPGREVPHGRAFMQSFLIGYANVVGNRLYEQRRTLIKEADDTTPGTAIAVRDRGAAVAAEYERLHPPSSFVRGTGTSNSSNAGYYAGRSAGARANLGGQSIGGGRRAIGR